MYRKEVNERSPLRILEQSIHGGLGKGNLGVVLARAGVGKRACLVQIALDDLLRDQKVLHIALEQTMDHVVAWYDTLFDDLAKLTTLDDAAAVRQMVANNRMISAFADHDLWPARLDHIVESMRDNLHFEPSVIVVDGYPWHKHTVAENAAMIGALKAYAKMGGAELWMSAQTHRERVAAHPIAIPEPCAELAGLIDVALFLEPHGDLVSIRLLKDHANESPDEPHLELHPDVLRIEPEGGSEPPTLPTAAYTLLSGGAKGAEAAFGSCAEEWGMREINFSFAGRNPVRTRGVVELSDAALHESAVSAVYMQAHMHRDYPKTPLFQKTLQSIWHHVATASQVFIVGTILDDGTVKGGTGWGAELARHWSKPVFVFDQEKKSWFTWNEETWADAGEPTIAARRFCGGGTRELTDAGAAAIRSLFERSFDAAAA